MLNSNKRYIILIRLIILSAIGSLIHSCINDNYELIKKDPVKIKAVIIDEKIYRPNSPVSHDFYYAYQFEVRGKHFTGNSGSAHFKIGDSVEVQYLRTNPEISTLSEK
ncbi:hypothetical protein [Mucilaginibacter agri]|uniref:Uncharacterized protein n=1 Tax=Mucilaginibacter agri TaxID=2695265 RepID=A0A965ZDL4_9SPHI|nr:hypothetical protein [Mucilaginibacter agri]NCD68820.1 hypothetical protein [Mucilaginibacter agri]